MGVLSISRRSRRGRRMYDVEKCRACPVREACNECDRELSCEEFLEYVKETKE